MSFEIYKKILTRLAWTEGEFHPPYLKTPFSEIFYVNNVSPFFGLFLNTYIVPVNSKIGPKTSVRV